MSNMNRNMFQRNIAKILDHHGRGVILSTQTRVDHELQYFYHTLSLKDIVDNSDVQKILDSFRDKFNVDVVYICEAFIDKTGFMITHSSYTEGKFNCKGLQKKLSPLSWEQMVHGYAEGHLSNDFLEDSYHEVAEGSILHYGIFHNDEWDGSVGIIDCHNKRVWTEEEKLALQKLGRSLKGIILNSRIQKLEKLKAADIEASREAEVHNSRIETLGLCKKMEFFNQVDAMKCNMKSCEWCVVAIDVEHFKLFNSWYGKDKGDEFLIEFAQKLKEIETQYSGIAAYCGADDFAMLIPDRETVLQSLKDELKHIALTKGNKIGFLPAIGVYGIYDTTVPAISMYEYAVEAAQYIHGNYDKRIMRYNSNMSESVEKELLLLSEIKQALDTHQFIFYVQPKCDISNGKVVGGEALVRWQHPTKGMIPPAVFIPILERNGFVSGLDSYVWEEVCKKLAGWIEQGLHPVPISINVSRIDILSMDVTKFLLGITQKYKIPHELLKIEITEGVYADNNNIILETVQKLKEAGFTILMDDFGSGYSSLNMLKSVTVDVIKLDMKFLDINEEETKRGFEILESIINMSSSLGLPVIVEGVETKRQEDYLLGIGVRYVQGYYYYKPMSTESFEHLIANEKNVDYKGIFSKPVEQLRVRELMDISLFNDSLINNMLGPTAFYDMYDNDIKITRVNEQYYRMVCGEAKDNVDYVKQFWNHMYESDRESVLRVFNQAADNTMVGAKSEGRFIRADGSVVWIHYRVFMLQEQEGHKLFFSIISDYYDLKKDYFTESSNIKNQLMQNTSYTLEEIYDDMPYALGIGNIVLDSKNKPCDYEINYINREMKKICASDINRMKNLSLKMFANDRETLLSKCYAAAYEGRIVKHIAYSQVSRRYLKLIIYPYKKGMAGVILQDVTKNVVYENALKSMIVTNSEVYFIHLGDDYFRKIYPDENNIMERGDYTKAIERKIVKSKLSAKDDENVRRFMSIEGIRAALENKDYVDCCYHRNGDGDINNWCIARITAGERVHGKLQTAVLMIQAVNEHDQG